MPSVCRTALLRALFVCFCLWSLTLGKAHAQDRTAIDYDTAIEHALVASQQGDWLAAREWFERAHALAPNARTLRGQAIAAFELGELVRAHGLLVAALAHAERPLEGALRASVEKLRDDLEQRLARLRIEFEGETGALRVDGENAEADTDQWLVPGQHRVVATNGPQTVERELALGPGESQVLRILFSAPGNPASPPPHSEAFVPAPPVRQRQETVETPRLRAEPQPWAMRTFAVASAVLAAGAGATWLTAWLKQTDIKESCRERAGGCTPEEVHEMFVDHHMSARVWVSRVGLGLSLASGIGATVIAVRRRRATSLEARLHPNGVSATLKF